MREQADAAEGCLAEVREEKDEWGRTGLAGVVGVACWSEEAAIAADPADC